MSARWDQIFRIVRAVESGDFSRVSDADIASLSPSSLDKQYREWCREHRPNGEGTVTGLGVKGIEEIPNTD